MKFSIHIECENTEELLRMSKTLEELGKKPLQTASGEKLPQKLLNTAKMKENEKIRGLNPPPGARLIPLTKWINYYPWPPIGGLRHLVFYADRNGFNACIKRVGRRVLIDEKAFFEWVGEC